MAVHSRGVHGPRDSIAHALLQMRRPGQDFDPYFDGRVPFQDVFERGRPGPETRLPPPLPFVLPPLPPAPPVPPAPPPVVPFEPPQIVQPPGPPALPPDIPPAPPEPARITVNPPVTVPFVEERNIPQLTEERNIPALTEERNIPALTEERGTPTAPAEPGGPALPTEPAGLPYFDPLLGPGARDLSRGVAPGILSRPLILACLPRRLDQLLRLRLHRRPHRRPDLRSRLSNFWISEGGLARLRPRRFLRSGAGTGGFPDRRSAVPSQACRASVRNFIEGFPDSCSFQRTGRPSGASSRVRFRPGVYRRAADLSSRDRARVRSLPRISRCSVRSRARTCWLRARRMDVRRLWRYRR